MFYNKKLMSFLFDFPLECPVLPGYFFTRDGTFSVGTPDGPFFRGYPCKVKGKIYRRIKLVSGEFKLVHRMVAFTYVNNPCPEEFNLVDHINGDTECNLDTNLRWANPVLNSANSGARNAYLSVKRPIRVKGRRVWVKSEPRWESRITIDHVQYRLGFSKTEEEACRVSRAFRKKRFREIYLGYIQKSNDPEAAPPSLDLQPTRPPSVTAESLLHNSRVEWVDTGRSARMYIYDPHS